MTETDINNALRIAASNAGWRLWRNNVGAGKLENGSFIRWGLANESKTMNAFIKSGDLIGIRPVLILPEHVGMTIGQFVSRECKLPGWKFNSKDARDVAQDRWVQLVNLLGGDAKITTGEL